MRIDNLNELIRDCIDRTVMRRYADQDMPFERAADLTELKLSIISGLIARIRQAPEKVNQRDIDGLVSRCVDEVVSQRYDRKNFKFERTADIVELKDKIIGNIVFTFKREMGVLPGQTPMAYELAGQPPGATPGEDPYEDPPIPESPYT